MAGLQLIRSAKRKAKPLGPEEIVAQAKAAEATIAREERARKRTGEKGAERAERRTLVQTVAEGIRVGLEAYDRTAK